MIPPLSAPCVAESEFHAVDVPADAENGAVRAEFLRKRSSEKLAHAGSPNVTEDLQDSSTSVGKNNRAPAQRVSVNNGSEAGTDLDGVEAEEPIDTGPRWKTFMVWCVDGTPGTIFMTLVTIWALFGDDIRLISTYKEADDGFTVVTIFCLLCFSVELGFASIAKEGFTFSFYFWLDLIATVSLLFDIPDVFALMTGVEETDSTVSPTDSSGSADNSQMKESATLTRAGRTSRAGTRAGRIVRLVRLVRILKLYKQYTKSKQLADGQADPEEELAESRVGQKLSDLTTRRVIVGVLMMLFIMPLFDVTTFDEPETLMEGGLQLVEEAYLAANDTQSPGFLAALDAYVNKTEGMYWVQVVNVSMSQRHGMKGPDYRSLRGVEVVEAVLSGGSFAKFDVREASVLQAVLNILRTVFICLILGLGALFFSRDANNLVLMPIERMMKKVKDMAENPLQKQEFAGGSSADGSQQFETKILENAFAKICSLMAVGFGEAGAEIIAENLKNGGELNPMVPGKKMVAIFGFCDIRQFTDATEILQEGVMEFVNSIAKIVHMEVSLHMGSANKNIGDAFLLVWKFPQDCTLNDISRLTQGPMDPKLAQIKKEHSKMERIQKIGDSALASFVVIMAMLRKSARLRAYSDNKDLCARMPNYSVKMGFGLHVGWAIEGAIGSEYKVDASYLSPNVNMAARLEAATKQFGTPLLLTEDFANILTPNTRAKCRQIDRVTVKGSIQPMGLFTYDVDVDKQVIDMQADVYQKDPEAFTGSNQDYEDEFEEHPDCVETRGWTQDFLDKFAMGFTAYRDGDWQTAKAILKECETMRIGGPNNEPIKDGPSSSLLRVMEEENFKAPVEW
eukprot:CAMPEP_0114238114 /NCGR_PEP_ID=MMETSP0058-20121206/7752_1 /TAXON_ID=36894 /ORGANISM="Pyramimonas parkeae, CCMP726" /LENGTH=849 /DNA_ID=CAMNT_0001350203 /DNA_START=611 /DNA_END=3157 /DNA_ORIENTATION=-